MSVCGFRTGFHGLQMVYFSGGGSHMLTLGLPDTVDYYVTGDATTPASLQFAMSEQLVRIGDIGIFHYQPADVEEPEVFQVWRLAGCGVSGAATWPRAPTFV